MFLPTSQAPTTFTPYQKLVVAILAFLQFSIILDFMIISPLGAMLIPALHITPSQFGVVVSVYAFSAAASGIAAAGFADRFDRKKFLLFFYCGFVLGTLLCGLAPTFEFLLFGRMVTGVFAGVIGSAIMAITTDLFPLQMRGRVMGVVQTAFAGSQVLGLPLGLYLANHWGWHAPFLMIVAFGTVAGGLITIYMKPVTAHLAHRVDKHALHHLWHTVATPRYLFAFIATGFMSMGGFMLMPFSSAFTVNNLGIDMAHLPFIYLVTGAAAIITGPMVGRLSDTYGKYKTFVGGAALTVLMVLIYTHLGITPLPEVMLVNVIMFVGIFARMIPAQALISAIPGQSDRGAFMAVNSSLQQVAGGIASVIAGLIVVQKPSGVISHFDTVGYILTGTVTLTVAMMYVIHRRVPELPKK